MSLVCIHCYRAFDAPEDPPSTSDLVTCPGCGLETPRDGGAGDTDFYSFQDGPLELHCLECGELTEPLPGELVPLCDACRDRPDRDEPDGPLGALEPGVGVADGGPWIPGRADALLELVGDLADDGDAELSLGASSSSEDAAVPEGERSWMIRRSSGGVYGPFGRRTILRRVARGTVARDDELSVNGGPWVRVHLDPEFGHLLPTPKASSIPDAREDVSFRVRPPPLDVGRVARPVVVIVVGLLLLGAIAWGASSVAMVWLDGSAESEDQPTDEAARLLERLSRDHPELLQPDAEQASSMELSRRGREEALRGAVEDLHDARNTLEQAVVLDPANALALASLSEVYCLLVYRRAGSLELLSRSIHLLRLADATGAFTPEVRRARAAFLIHSGSVAEGEALARQALRERPDDPALHYLLGLAALTKHPEEPDVALAHFDRALELDPGFQEVLYVLGIRAFEEGRASEAVDYFQRQLEQRPNSSEVHAILGLIHQFAGDYERATSHFDQAIERNPSLGTAVVPRAVVTYQRDGEAARAAEAMERQLASADSAMTLRVRRGLTLHLSAARRLAGDIEGALAAADEVLAADSTEEAAWFHRALALAETDRPLDAVPAFARADAAGLHERLRARVVFHSGVALLGSKQWKEAMEAFQRSVEIDPDWVPGYLWAAYVGLRLGDPERAARSVLDHVERDPLGYTRDRDADVFFQPLPSLEPVVAGFRDAVEVQWFAPELNAALGILLFHHGDAETARTHLDLALEQEERNEVARYYLGLIELAAGRHLAAGAHFLALVSVQHDRGMYHHYLGEAFLGQERYAEAIEEFERGLQYKARSAWAYSRLAEARFRQGEVDAAREALLEALELDPTAVAPRRLLFELER